MRWSGMPVRSGWIRIEASRIILDYMAIKQYCRFTSSSFPSPKVQPMTGQPDFKRQSAILKALANESRLKIVHRLGAGDCAVSELVALVGLDQSTVSKHLAVLRNCGIVEDRRRGTAVDYSLRTPCVLEFLGCATQVIEDLR